MATKHIRRVNANSGFTLIELLIAATLTLFILTTASFAYQLFSGQWSRNLSHFEREMYQAKLYDMLSEALHGIEPYLVGGGDGRGFYFLGRTNGFTAVTSSPIVNVGSHAVIRVFSEVSDSGIQLVYEEASLKSTLLLESAQTLPFTERIVIATTSGELTYRYGVQQIAIDDSIINNNAEPEIKTEVIWLEEIDGLQLKQHPVSIIINFDGFPIYAQVASRQRVLSNRAMTEFF